jgi:F-box interacting protein
MGSEARRTKPGTEKTTIHHLCEDNIIEILLRLPGKSIYRCRAVCKAWHSATTAPEFLAAHSLRQQAQVVLHTYQAAVRLVNNRASPATMALDLLPVSSPSSSDGGAGRRQRLIRCLRKVNRMGSCLLLSSCNGVLLFKRPDRSYILCNPATRKFAEIPRRNLGISFAFELVFYFHNPSDEYKLLCRYGSSSMKLPNGPNWWYVLSTDGAAENLQRQQIADRRITEASDRIDALLEATPVDLHGRLHWLASPQSSNAVETSSEMVVFEAESETFHVMAGLPGPNNKHVKLFCMDGLLAAADFGVANRIDLWFLEDYGAGRWECRHRVATPCPAIRACCVGPRRLTAKGTSCWATTPVWPSTT